MRITSKPDLLDMLLTLGIFLCAVIFGIPFVVHWVEIVMNFWTQAL